jgi:anti-sigma regulatory factor (Ser/Thr protein kinase)
VTGPKHRRTRIRLLGALVLLAVWWALAAVPAGTDALDAFRDRGIRQHLGQPTDMIILALQDERRLSTGYLGGGDQETTLAAHRLYTDAARTALRTSAGGAWVRRLTGTDAVRRTDELLTHLDRLPDIRAAIDGRQLDWQRAATAYTEIIDIAFRQGPPMWQGPDATGGGFAGLSRARELLSQEDALVRGALAAGGLTAEERLRLSRIVGAQRLLRADADGRIPAAARDDYRRLAGESTFQALRLFEDLLATDPAGTAVTAPTVAAWTQTVDPVHAQLRAFEVTGVRDVVTARTPAAVGTIVRAGLLNGLGLIAALTLLAMAVRAARRRSEPDGADEAAAVASVSGAGAGSGSSDGAGWTDADRRLYALLLDLQRRNQSLLHRQLRILDTMERRASDDESLADLFRVDHLATRLRRNVEKAISLTGGTPARRWRQPVPLVDVVRAAAAEITEFARVSTSQIEPGALAGSAVTDVTHLLAELVDNATVFAPADTRVRVVGVRRDDGYAITVTDAGRGMDDDDLATAHEVMGDVVPPAAGAWWGLYTVGRLADRQSITVTLRGEPGRGLTAELVIPPDLLVGAATGWTATSAPAGAPFAVDLSATAELAPVEAT